MVLGVTAETPSSVCVRLRAASPPEPERTTLLCEGVKQRPGRQLLLKAFLLFLLKTPSSVINVGFHLLIKVFYGGGLRSYFSVFPTLKKMNFDILVCSYTIILCVHLKFRLFFLKKGKVNIQRQSGM